MSVLASEEVKKGRLAIRVCMVEASENHQNAQSVSRNVPGSDLMHPKREKKRFENVFACLAFWCLRAASKTY